MKLPSRERLLRHRAKMQRQWQANWTIWMGHGVLVEPRFKDAQYLWVKDQIIHEALKNAKLVPVGLLKPFRLTRS